MSLPKLTAHRPTSMVPGLFSTNDARGVFHVHGSGWDEMRELSVIPPPPSLACFTEGDEGIPFPLALIEFRVGPSVSLETTCVVGMHCLRPPQRASKPQVAHQSQNLPGLRDCSKELSRPGYMVKRNMVGLNQ
ncbi:hypothetical protein B5X24_HaOG205799 [Helicoverpa armigera]|nr:hypothetical protein B5X24_HaOG205799 [Helicoverpa armigera]